MFKNKLKINQEKTEFLIIANRQNKKNIAVDHMVLDNTVFKRTNKAKNLDVSFNSEMNMQIHIRDIGRKCFCDIKWLLICSEDLCPKKRQKILVHALIISRLDHCNSLLFRPPKTNS